MQYDFRALCSASNMFSVCDFNHALITRTFLPGYLEMRIRYFAPTAVQLLTVSCVRGIVRTWVRVRVYAPLPERVGPEKMLYIKEPFHCLLCIRRNIQLFIDISLRNESDVFS